MPAAADSLTISRNRRRTRLRSTALPTCRDTVNPMRIAPPVTAWPRLHHEGSAGNARTCSPRPESRCGVSAARRRRERALPSRTETLAPARAPRRDDLAAALGRHACAKTMPALAHQFARLVSSFHGIFSAARQDPRLLGSRLSIRHEFSTRAARGWRGLYGSPPGSSMRCARAAWPCNGLPAGPEYRICVTEPRPDVEASPFKPSPFNMPSRIPRHARVRSIPPPDSSQLR